MTSQSIAASEIGKEAAGAIAGSVQDWGKDEGDKRKENVEDFDFMITTTREVVVPDS